MIRMFFEGGYVYNMTEGEYKMLITLTCIGAASVISAGLAIGVFLISKISYGIKSLRKA